MVGNRQVQAVEIQDILPKLRTTSNDAGLAAGVGRTDAPAHLGHSVVVRHMRDAARNDHGDEPKPMHLDPEIQAEPVLHQRLPWKSVHHFTRRLDQAAISRRSFRTISYPPL